MWFHFLFISEEQWRVTDMYFVCLVSDIENVLSEEHEHFRKTEIHTNWMNSLFKKNVHLVFYSCLKKNLSKPWQRLEMQETIRHSLVLCFVTYSTEWWMISVLFPVNMQTSDYLAIILPECIELDQRKVSVQKQQEKKPSANTKIFKEERWAAIHPQVALENSGDQKQNNLHPNELVACSSFIPESQQIWKPYRCWDRQNGEWLCF